MDGKYIWIKKYTLAASANEPIDGWFDACQDAVIDHAVSGVSQQGDGL